MDTTILFVDTPSITFNCTRVNDSLRCITPNVNGKLLPFNNYALSVSNKTLAINYTVYETRQISSISTRVIPLSLPSFQTNITLDTSLRAVVGEFAIIMNANQTFDSRANFPFFTETRTSFNATIAIKPSFIEASYPLEVYFQLNMDN